MKKLILFTLITCFSGTVASQIVEALGDSNHYRMSEKLSMDVAKNNAKTNARLLCESESLVYGSWTYSQWYQYGCIANSSNKAERDGFRHTVRIKARCK